MRCNACSGEIPDGARFCPHCGVPVAGGIRVHQVVEEDRGTVTGAVLAKSGTGSGRDLSVDQEIGTVAAGGAAVGVVMGQPDSHIHIGGEERHGDTVQGNKQTVNTGGGAYIGGKVSTGGGKFVGRDAVTIIGDGNVLGDHSRATVVKQAHPDATVEAFARLLAEMRALLPQAGLDPDTAAVVDADVRVVEQQAAKDQPNRAIVASKLEEVTKLLTAAGGLAAAGRNLLPLVQKAVEWAGQLFR